jgi:hypothetical protein
MTDSVRRPPPWRLPVIIAGVVLLGGAVIAWLQPKASSTAYLNPGNTQPDGGHALAAILAQRGEQVITVTTANAAVNDSAGTDGGTILVTSPSMLTADQLATIGRARADVVLTDADPAALAALAPEVTAAGQAPATVLSPGCTLQAAALAGTADLGGTLLSTRLPAAQRCCPDAGFPSLIRYTAGARQITVLGTGAPFTNQYLASVGNAALALNVLGQESGGRVIWLAPTASAAATPASGGQASFTSLIPKPVFMIAIQLLIAVLLLALWRVRRLGPLVAERLPAVVRAAETAEGHGRLYQARRARGRAGEVLRKAAIGRMLPALGLPPDAEADVVTAAVAARTGEPAAEVTTALAGPAPGDDAALVMLADRLDELERRLEVR